MNTNTINLYVFIVNSTKGGFDLLEPQKVDLLHGWKRYA